METIILNTIKLPSMAAMVHFTKMHGLGNDFVIIDLRANGGQENIPAPSSNAVRLISDRRLGVGCDQLILLEHSDTADVFMRIFNVDGSEVSACGNATRCVAALLMPSAGSISIRTRAGLLGCRAVGDAICANMGTARFDWAEIPLATDCDTAHVPLSAGGASDPVAVNVGNPHCVFFAASDDMLGTIAEVGREIETHAMFPERTNVELALPTAAGFRVAVWERGVGITAACGSAACAVVAAAVRRGLWPAGRKAHVQFSLGSLEIELANDGSVLMTGPATLAFCGDLPPSLYNTP